MTWLRCDIDQQKKSLVSTLWCDVCRRYEQRICGLRVTRRVNQQPRKEYRKRKANTAADSDGDSQSEDEESTMTLEDWDSWFSSGEPMAD